MGTKSVDPSRDRPGNEILVVGMDLGSDGNENVAETWERNVAETPYFFFLFRPFSVLKVPDV